MGAAPQLVALIALPAATAETLARRFALHSSSIGALASAENASMLSTVRGVITNGSTGLSGAQMAALPQLEIICAFGAGFENIDVAAAARRGIVVTNAPGTNTETVADHAVGLMLALARKYVELDRRVRAGEWEQAREARPALFGASLGILGLGQIGRAIARRATAFGMSIAYCNRRPLPTAEWRFVAAPLALAAAVDFLVVCCPGGAATRHIVNAGVLKALGPDGYLINVSRGSTVDTAALALLLQSGHVAGAALDVVEGEPDVPAALLAAPNVVFTPHVAGRSPVAQRAQERALLEALEAQFSGAPVPHTVARSDA
jgi:lactate dehydrogenase-like 2-hydroxyacid dehydrogenase